jgi:hypothetical protein
VALTKAALPKRIRELATEGKCDDARLLAEFAERSGFGSTPFRSSLGPCK